MLNAGKTKPTIGTKIEGKKAAVIIILKKIESHVCQFKDRKLMILIVCKKKLE